MSKSKDTKELLQHLEKLFLIDNTLKRTRVEVKAYKDTLENFDIECIPNFYSQALRNDEFTVEGATYTQVLYKTLWGFLYTNIGSSTDIEHLIKSLNKNSIEKTNDYLKNNVNKSYEEFRVHLYNKYGFDANEFRDQKLNCSEHGMSNKENFNNLKFSLFDTKDGIYSYGFHPHYYPLYDYPTLKQLNNNRVSFEFSIMDDEIEIMQELKKILKKERKYKRREISSTTNAIYKQLNFSNENKFQSEKVLIQSLIIYQYLQYTRSIKQATLIYNFHLLHFHNQNFNPYPFKDIKRLFRGEEVREILSYDMASHNNFISYNRSSKEIRIQINQIKLLLNL